jgi:hypothetical protein
MSSHEWPENYEASTDGVLANLRPEDVFHEDFLKRYKEYHADIWHRLIRLHGTIHVLESLESFPLDKVIGPNAFWRLVIENFFDVATIALNSLLNDAGGDTHTLSSFRDDCVKAQLKDEAHRDALLLILKARKFDQRIKDLKKKIKSLRDAHVAHRLKDQSTGLLEPRIDQVSVRELRQLFGAASSLFGAVCIGSSFATLELDLIPGTVGGKPHKSAIEEILDLVAKDSYFVNLPERRKAYWPTKRKSMSGSDLQLLNTLRAGFGLPEV